MFVKVRSTCGFAIRTWLYHAFCGCHDLRDGGLGDWNGTAIDDINSVLESSSHQNMHPFTRSLTLYDKLRSGENLLQSY